MDVLYYAYIVGAYIWHNTRMVFLQHWTAEIQGMTAGIY